MHTVRNTHGRNDLPRVRTVKFIIRSFSVIPFFKSYGIIHRHVFKPLSLPSASAIHFFRSLFSYAATLMLCILFSKLISYIFSMQTKSRIYGCAGFIKISRRHFFQRCIYYFVRTKYRQEFFNFPRFIVLKKALFRFRVTNPL